MKLELVCCKKTSPSQETALGNREPLEALIDTKLIVNDQRSHSFSLGLDLFCRFLQQTSTKTIREIEWLYSEFSI